MHITEVELTVPDAAAAATFFSEALDCATRPVAGGAAVLIGSSTLRLHQAVAASGSHHVAFNVAKHRFDETQSWLRRRVALLERQGRDEFRLPAPWNSRSVYFVGPGLLLEVIARDGLPAAGGPGTSDSPRLGCISEVGIPTVDVTGTTSRVCGALGVEPFGTSRPDFTAVGNDEGLLVLVQPGRIWFPSGGLRPSLAPIAVTVEGAPGQRIHAQDGEVTSSRTR